MCDACGGGPNEERWTTPPGTPERLEEVRLDQAKTILERGHQVMHIFDPESHEPDFFYTVGRSLWGFPDLLLTGNLSQAQGLEILNDIADQEASGKIKVADLAGTGPVEVENFTSKLQFIRCDPTAPPMTSAMAVAGRDDIEAYQVVFPDALGNWPWESAFAYGPDAEPIYAL